MSKFIDNFLSYSAVRQRRELNVLGRVVITTTMTIAAIIIISQAYTYFLKIISSHCQ